MAKVTIDEVEYDTDNMTDDQKNILNVLNKGSNSMGLLEHITQCVNAIQQIKVTELKKSLEVDDDKSD
tara:strand:+ start:341 stop:544 length:204 start_codon:yes stop_codon:yes gene_type:complete